MAEDETFETQDAGAADSYPIEAGQIRKGGHIMIKVGVSEEPATQGHDKLLCMRSVAPFSLELLGLGLPGCQRPLC